MSTDMECATNEPSLSPTPHSTDWINAKGRETTAIQIRWETESTHEQTRFSQRHRFIPLLSCVDRLRAHALAAGQTSEARNAPASANIPLRSSGLPQDRAPVPSMLQAVAGNCSTSPNKDYTTETRTPLDAVCSEHTLPSGMVVGGSASASVPCTHPLYLEGLCA